MDFLRSKVLLRCFLVLLLGACLTLGRQPELESDEFSYDEESPNGPSQWGNIKPEWSTCSTGKMQSPIDISDCGVVCAPELGRLQRHYRFSIATLVNRGHDMMLQWIHGGGDLLINDTNYQLKECHWHSPSEHLIHGRRFDLEIHLVHQSSDGRIAMIGMVYEIGSPNSFLSSIEHDLKELAHTIDDEKVIGYVDPEWVNIGRGKYYRYMGSHTTPPCSENVVWTVMGKVDTVSRKQLDYIRWAIHGELKTNARPVQPLNKRLIQLYKPQRRNSFGDFVEYVPSSLDKSL